MSCYPNPLPSNDDEVVRTITLTSKRQKILIGLAVLFAVAIAVLIWIGISHYTEGTQKLAEAEQEMAEAQALHETTQNALDAFENSNKLIERLAKLEYDVIRWKDQDDNITNFYCFSIEVHGPFPMDYEGDWFNEIDGEYQHYAIGQYADVGDKIFYNYIAPSPGSSSSRLYTYQLIEVSGSIYRIDGYYSDYPHSPSLWGNYGSGFDIELHVIEGHNRLDSVRNLTYGSDGVVNSLPNKGKSPCGCKDCCCGAVCNCNK